MFSAREVNFATEEEGSVCLAAAWSDALERVRTARELFARVIWIPFEGEGHAHPIIRSFGARSVRFRFLSWCLGGASLGTDGPGTGDGWLKAAVNR